MGRGTPDRIGRNAGRFERSLRKLYAPPFNMIAERDLIRRFNLPAPIREYGLSSPQGRIARIARLLSPGT